MAQLFAPSANTIARASLVVFAAVPVLGILTGSAISRSSANTGVGVPLDQPIPFSHKHHAFELGIDCRYCHTSVEKSAVSGLPQTETCMSCHSQIWTNSPLLEPVRQSFATGTPIQWNLVNKAPEFVFFNHSIHIDRGVSCNNCHGAIQKMQITAKGKAFQMVWCLECHREPEKYLYTDEKNPDLSPREQVFNLYLKAQTDPEGGNMMPVERSLLAGLDQKVPAADVKKGADLVVKRGIKKVQLADCAVCHH